MKIWLKTRISLSPITRIIALSLLLMASAKATTLLSDTQIIQQVERLYSGKVISVSKPSGLKTVQVNILMHNADILRLTIDPVTGKTISRKKEMNSLKRKKPR